MAIETWEIVYIFTVDVDTDDGETPEEAAAQYLSQEHSNMEPSSTSQLA